MEEEIKAYLTNHTVAQANREFARCRNTITFIGRSLNYAEFYMYRGKPSYFSKYPMKKSLASIDRFNDEWYFNE